MAYSYYPDKLAQLVRAYRDREGLSLRDLATQTQISAATLSRIENGKQAKFVPDTYTLLILVNTCGLPFDEIIRGDDDSGRSQIQDISTQLRASKQVSAATMQALEAVIRAVRLQQSSEKVD